MGKESSRDSAMVCEVLVLWERERDSAMVCEVLVLWERRAHGIVLVLWERRSHGIVLWFVRCWCYGKGELTG